MGLGDLMQHGLLFKYIVASLFRVTWGFGLAVVVAVPLGMIIGCYGRAKMAFSPLIQILRPISPLAWIPIAILWFGVGDLSAIFSYLYGKLLPTSGNRHERCAQCAFCLRQRRTQFRFGNSRVVLSRSLPASVPQLIVGLRITLGIAWLVVVAAEMIAVNSGLGFLIVDARNAGDRYDLVIAGMVMIG